MYLHSTYAAMKVLDITRWLSEHPGGSTIIPEQALNIDCSVFFEIYHASRISFMYLKVLTTKSYVVNIYAVCTYYACNNNFAKFLLM